MILFDLIVTQNITGLSRDLALDHGGQPVFCKSSKSMSKSLALAYVAKNPEILIGSKIDLANRNFIQKNYWQKIVNNAWRQVIFLSIPAKSYHKYVVELNYLNTNKDQWFNKRLVSNFSQSLLEGSVASLVSTEPISSTAVSAVQYDWRKSLKLKQEKILSLFKSDPNQHYIQRIKKYLTSNIFADHFPLFVVSNYLGQMIISEPPSELEEGRDLLEYIMPVSSARHLSQAWFFTSFEDAQEYMASIADYYDLQKGHLKIFTCGFSDFYNAVDKFGHKVYFRLVPDLQEVSNLIKKYRTYRNISFYKGQNYSSTSFQGQPLYMLKAKKQHNKPHDISCKNNLGAYDLLFTSYVTACNVLQKNVLKSFDAKKSQQPDLLVYNLESFIQDELSKDDPASSFLLVPSENTYCFTKKYFLQKKANLINDAILNYLLPIHLWSKRILWSLTSRQPKC